MSKLEELDPEVVDSALDLIEAAESGDPSILAAAVTALVVANNPAYAVLGPVITRGLSKVLGGLGGRILGDDEDEEDAAPKRGFFSRLFGWL